MTQAHAATVGESHLGGTLAVGKWADIVVLPDVPDERPDMPFQVEATFSGGELVFDRGGEV
jgi:imidazolonepropionase-like amidohydrolase